MARSFHVVVMRIRCSADTVMTEWRPLFRAPELPLEATVAKDLATLTQRLKDIRRQLHADVTTAPSKSLGKGDPRPGTNILDRTAELLGLRNPGGDMILRAF